MPVTATSTEKAGEDSASRKEVTVPKQSETLAARIRAFRDKERKLEDARVRQLRKMTETKATQTDSTYISKP